MRRQRRISLKAKSFTLAPLRYVAAADAGDICHLPLALGTLAVQAIAQLNHLPLLFGQAPVHGLAQAQHHLPGGNLLQQVAVLTDHVHQLQRRPVGAGFDVIRQGNILGAFALGAEVHQDFVCYPPPNDF